MKGFLITALLAVSGFNFTSTASADECKCRPLVSVVKAVHPCDVVKSLGAFTKEATCRTAEGVGNILKGTGKVLSAPFKSKFNWPKTRTYRWYRGHWHEVKPVPPLRIEMGKPVEPEGSQFIPVPYVDPEVRDTIVLYRLKF